MKKLLTILVLFCMVIIQGAMPSISGSPEISRGSLRILECGEIQKTDIGELWTVVKCDDWKGYKKFRAVIEANTKLGRYQMLFLPLDLKRLGPLMVYGEYIGTYKDNDKKTLPIYLLITREEAKEKK